MRKNYFLFIALLISTLSFGQEMLLNGDFESWDDVNTPSNYSKAESVTQESSIYHGGSYSAKQVSASTQDIAQDISGIVPGESYTLSLWYMVESGDGTDARIWSYWLNGTSTVTDSATDAQLRGPDNSYFDNNGNVWTQYTTTLVAPAGVDGFRFEVRSYSSSTVYWDDLSFVHVQSSTPSLAILSPGDNTSYNPLTTSVDVTLSVQNFNVANGTGDGHIVYTINGGSENDKYDTSVISVPVETGNSYSVYVELVDNSGNPLSTPVNATVNFSVASIGQVSTLTALRNGTVGQYYELTGEAVISYARSTRNQKYIEDNTVAVTKSASGSGILIDDNLGIITSTYNQYDGISGLKGQLVDYNGLLEFVPLEDPGSASSTGNTITPEEVTLTELSTNWNNYESELVKIKGVTFAAGDGSAVFASSTNYDISDGGTTITFRTLFSEADYIGQLIPTGSQDIVVLVGEFNGTPQVVTRDLADMTATLGVNRNAIEGFSIFPNPVTNGKIWINTKSNNTKQVKVFDILGKQLISTNVVGRELNISKLTCGIYILKVVQEGKTSTRKLVVK